MVSEPEELVDPAAEFIHAAQEAYQEELKHPEVHYPLDRRPSARGRFDEPAVFSPGPFVERAALAASIDAFADRVLKEKLPAAANSFDAALVAANPCLPVRPDSYRGSKYASPAIRAREFGTAA